MRTTLIAVALVVAACGGGADAETSEVPDAAATTTTTVETPTTTVAPTTTTTTVPEPSLADLSEGELASLMGLCAGGHFDPQVAEFELQAMVGHSGLPSDVGAALQNAHDEWAAGADIHDALAALAPVCAEAGVESPEQATETTVAAVPATVTITIGDLSLEGMIDACPVEAIDAGEPWIVQPREPWVAADGTEWRVESLSVDRQTEWTWNFSVSDGTHRLYANDEWELPFEPEVGEGTATFHTVFQDSLASVSGGWPDTEGTVAIICG